MSDFLDLFANILGCAFLVVIWCALPGGIGFAVAHFATSATGIWTGLLLFFMMNAFIGFFLNTNTPIQVGPLPAVFLGFAMFAFIVLVRLL